MAQATAPILDSTKADMAALADDVRCRGYSGSRRSTRCHHQGVTRLLGRKSENISNVDDDCQ
jgi:hypothetical protein